MRDIQRTDQGYRCGASHHNAKYSDAVVNQVRDLHDLGLGWRRISRQLELSPNWVKRICDFECRAIVRPTMEASV